MLRVTFVCFLACFLQTALGQFVNSYGYNGAPLNNGFADNFGNGLTLGPNNAIAATANAAAINAAAGNNVIAAGGLPGLPISAISPIGYGDVTLGGELPVGGSTAVAGNVPVIGYVNFEGVVPAGGMVSLASNCGCNGQIVL